MASSIKKPAGKFHEKSEVPFTNEVVKWYATQKLFYIIESSGRGVGWGGGCAGGSGLPVHQALEVSHAHKGISSMLTAPSLKCSVANSCQNFSANPGEKFVRWEKKFGPQKF